MFAVVVNFFFNRALQFADVIVLFGARLNWILHFGLPPRYQADVKFIQVLGMGAGKTLISSALFCSPSFVKNLFSYRNRFYKLSDVITGTKVSCLFKPTKHHVLILRRKALKVESETI